MLMRVCLLLMAVVAFCSSASSEASANSDLMAHIEPGNEYHNPVPAFTQADAMPAGAKTGPYYMGIEWGRLCFDLSVNVATDRSGSLNVNRGAEIAQRVIRFEPTQDHIVPSTDRRVIERAASASVYNHDIAVGIVIGQSEPVLDMSVTVDVSHDPDPAATSDENAAYQVLSPAEVVCEAGPCSSTFTLAEVSALDIIETEIAGQP